jgi:antitoxin MazE
METKITKWGNSLGVRVPKEMAEKAGFIHNQRVVIHALKKGISIEPVKENLSDLDVLVGRITKENLHQELDWGGTKGKEVW